MLTMLKAAGVLPLLIVLMLCGAAIPATVTSCGGSTSIMEEEHPAVTPETVYFQLIGTYELAGNRDKYDVNSSHILRPTFNVGGQLWTNLPSDQGKIVHIGVKNGIGELAVGYYTDAQVADTKAIGPPLYPMRWKQLDREQASGRPVLAYLTEVGTNKNAVVPSVNGSEELTGAMVRWQKGIPFGIKVPFRNRVDATPQGLGEVGARLNGIQFMAAWIERTITIHERSNSSWLVAAVVGLVQVAAAMPAACPGEENNSWIIFDDLGGNDDTVVPPPPANQPPTAALLITPASGLASQSRTLNASSSFDPDGSIVKYEWDFDGNGVYDATTTTSTTTHGYTVTATATVRVTDNGNPGLTDTATATATVTAPPVNQPPTARFTFVANELDVDFDASTSTDSDGTIASYSWNFGSTGVTTSHTYPAAGNYSVTLTVTDDDGATGTETKTVTVTAPSTGREYPDGQPFIESELRIVGTPGDSNGDGLWEETMRLNKTNWQFDTADLELYRRLGGLDDFIPGNWFQFTWESNAPDAAWDSDGTFYSQFAAPGTYDFVVSITLKTSPTWYTTTRTLQVEVYEE
jgi:PKD repeat protein